MSEDMDLNAGRIIEGEASLDDLGAELFEMIIAVANGKPTASEALGHAEFSLVYKSFEPLGPACLPAG
jgi:altronate hydrolase